jgi:serine protease Do
MMIAVKRSLLAFGAMTSLVCASAQAFAQPRALPPLPTEAGDDTADDTPAPAQAAQAAPAPAPQAATPQQLYERVRRGVVAIQRNGVPAAVGTVLSGDGRILTALSALGGGEGADVRYADGTSVHAKVERADKAFDLALLLPEPNQWKDGLQASEANPVGVDIRAMLPAHGAHFGPATAALKGRADAHARTGEPLLRMLDVDVQGPSLAGAPLLDASGAVIGVLVHACKGGPAAESADAFKRACQPVTLGAPVSAIRAFLSPLAGQAAVATPAAAPAAAAPPAPVPWLGIRVEPQASGDVHGVRVSGVAPGSPAEKAGLKAGSDVVVAVEGEPISAPENLAAAINKHAPGDTVKVLTYGAGQFRQVSVVLGSK